MNTDRRSFMKLLAAAPLIGLFGPEKEAQARMVDTCEHEWVILRRKSGVLCKKCPCRMRTFDFIECAVGKRQPTYNQRAFIKANGLLYEKQKRIMFPLFSRYPGRFDLWASDERHRFEWKLESNKLAIQFRDYRGFNGRW